METLNWLEQEDSKLMRIWVTLSLLISSRIVSSLSFSFSLFAFSFVASLQFSFGFVLLGGSSSLPPPSPPVT